ncbi:MAG: flavin monoamine oxidase family protein [Rickettsiales bacterium]
MHTAYIKNFEGAYSIAELGGQNISDGGVAKNFLTLAAEQGLDLLENYTDFNSLFYDGQNFIDAQKLLKNFNLTSDLDQQLDRVSKTDNSMQEVLDHIFPEDSALKRICTIRLTAYEGSPPTSLSICHNLATLKYMLLGGLSEAHQASNFTPQLHMQSLKNGNAMLPLTLSKHLGNRIKLNKILHAVSKNDNKIVLKFRDGSIVVCDKLILAIPALTYNDITFDDNVISEQQLNMIKSISYGENSKILIPIQYAKKTCNSIITDEMVTFFNGDQKLLNMYFINDDGTSRIKDQFSKQLSILKQAYTGAEFNELPPVDAEDTPFKQYNCPVAKSWVGDAYAKGSYSTYNVALGTKLAQTRTYKNIPIKEMFMPANDRVFFIGEHTTLLSEIGTMEAAVESGERIAKIISTKFG